MQKRMIYEKCKRFKRYFINALNINFLIIFMYLFFRILPERFLAFLKRKIDIRFDAVIGYKTKGQ